MFCYIPFEKVYQIKFLCNLFAIIMHFEIELKKLDDEFQNSRFVRHLHFSVKDSYL